MVWKYKKEAVVKLKGFPVYLAGKPFVRMRQLFYFIESMSNEAEMFYRKLNMI